MLARSQQREMSRGDYFGVTVIARVCATILMVAPVVFFFDEILTAKEMGGTDRIVLALSMWWFGLQVCVLVIGVIAAEMRARNAGIDTRLKWGVFVPVFRLALWVVMCITEPGKGSKMLSALSMCLFGVRERTVIAHEGLLRDKERQQVPQPPRRRAWWWL